MGSRYWRLRLRRWPRHTPAREGYTLLLPVPGDLPVFAQLALTACARQRSAHRRSTIVLPDRPSPTINAAVEARQPSWPDELRVQTFPAPERWVLPYLKSGSRNHGLQLIIGAGASDTTHVLLHDADLFPQHPGLLDAQYRACLDRNLACLGVSPVWDPWYASHGLRLAATWELCARVDWMRSFAPHLHIGHDGELFGESHTFDATLYPQALTDRALVDFAPVEHDFVHFNYVITAYRHYQRHGPGYVDDRFRLLLISLLSELFHAPTPGLPALSVLAESLGDRGGVIAYPSHAEAPASYALFREQLDRLLRTPWLVAEDVRRLDGPLAAFDQHYDYYPAST